MQAVPGPQRKRRCQLKELDWKPSVPLCFSAGAKKQHVLALRGCSRNVLSFPNRKKHLEITRDSGLNNTEGRGCCGVKGKAKGLSSVTLIPPKSPWECSSDPSETLHKIRVVSQHFEGDINSGRENPTSMGKFLV